MNAIMALHGLGVPTPSNAEPYIRLRTTKPARKIKEFAADICLLPQG